MIGQGLVQIVANIPTNAEPIRRMPHQLPFRTDALEKHHELELKEDDGIDGWTTTAPIYSVKAPSTMRTPCPLEKLNLSLSGSGIPEESGIIRCSSSLTWIESLLYADSICSVNGCDPSTGWNA